MSEISQPCHLSQDALKTSEGLFKEHLSKYGLLSKMDYAKDLLIKHHHKGYSVEMESLAIILLILKTDSSCPPTIENEIIPYDIRTRVRRIFKSIMITENKKTQKCEIRPTIYVREALNRINAPDIVKAQAEEYSINTVKLGLHNGKKPVSIAAAIVYLAHLKTNYRLQMGVIAHVFNVSEVAVRENAREIMRGLGIKVDPASSFIFNDFQQKDGKTILIIDYGRKGTSQRLNDNWGGP